MKRILIIDDARDRAAWLKASLELAGFEVYAGCKELGSLCNSVIQTAPEASPAKWHLAHVLLSKLLHGHCSSARPGGHRRVVEIDQTVIERDHR